MFDYHIYTQLFSEYMPSWTTRGGCIDTRNKKIFPNFIVSIPIQFAPPSSLDLLFIEKENSPHSPVVLTSYLQTVAAGGVAIIHLNNDYWDKNLIKQTIEVCGFSILILEEVSESDIIQIENRKIKIIKKKQFDLKKSWLLLIKKKLFKPESELNYQFSFVLNLPSDQDKAVEKIYCWKNFIKKHKIYLSEILIYEKYREFLDDPESPEYFYIQSLENKNSNYILDGIYFSRGKNVFLDEEESTGNPEIFFELLDLLVKKNEPTKPVAIYFDSKEKRNYFRYRLYNTKSLNFFIRFYNEILFFQEKFDITKQIQKEGKIYFM